MGHFSESAPKIDEASETFVNKLAKDIVDDAVLDAAFKRSVKLNETDESEEDFLSCRTKHFKTGSPLDVRIVDFFFQVFTFKNMARYLVFLLALMLADTLWDVIADMYSRPTILKPKGPRPFFSNSSSNYLTDFYTGDFRPERFVYQTDLLVVMYYSPWSHHSQRLKHPFEVVALMLRNHKNIRLVAVNCWTTGGECRKTYKIFQYPIIVAYSSTVHSVYQGEHSTDHLYRFAAIRLMFFNNIFGFACRWIVNIRNPLRHASTAEELQQLRKEYLTLVIGYYPFKNMATPEGYRAFAAAGMMLQSGLLEDEATCFVVVTNTELARSLGVRFEGDILIYILKDRNTELGTDQFSQILNDSSVLVLITPLSRIYQAQADVALFTELAREYWNCQQENILLVDSADSVPEFVADVSLAAKLSMDKEACREFSENLPKMDTCCRSLLPSVDWNMACASSAKYHWEDEEENNTSNESNDSPKPGRRSHWTEQTLAATNECAAVRNKSSDANAVLARCCANYEEFSQLELTPVQKSNARSKLLARELTLADFCMRGRLHEYMKYPIINETTDLLGDPFPSANLSLKGMACNNNYHNNTLKFVILDLLHYSYFVKKWGLTQQRFPAVIAIDSKQELFSVMDGALSQKSVREFVRDFHSNLLSDRFKSEGDGIARIGDETEHEVLHSRIQSEQTLERLNLQAFSDLIENRTNSTDAVVLFTGGLWHTPSASAMHVYHDVASYFSSSGDLIRFYVVDTSRNELPYNFNFDRIPAIVIFLHNQTDISWKFPEVLPISQPNVLSFILSHCSSRLRWKMALANCGRSCATHNRLRLRKRQEKLLSVIHRIREGPQRQEFEEKFQYFVKQLRVVRRVLRALHSVLHQSEVLDEDAVNSLVHTKEFDEYIRD
ncbi:hypothetical protein OESDEN_03224 [Oesophagostomum dentatum]|uniref:Thioredoxin domain-containing protein n=1 Tax=Oesophagostomum dentatum TaxID=61180 RepID=A0A0B1TLW1_OESDE|nr:hypothetical protein OESDEN_03224 [Oesophagostomum dentatum]